MNDWRYEPHGDVDGDPNYDGKAGIDHMVVDGEGNEVGCFETEEIARMVAATPRAIAALVRLRDAMFAMMDKTDWGKSFYDASTIREMNEAPIQANAVIEEVTHDEATQAGGLRSQA